jgi:4-hydroxyproline epimerase
MGMRRIDVVDSHTGGEPTRVIVAGGPDLGLGSMAERRECFKRNHDRWRRAVICEPRGSDVIVGAVLCEPSDAANSVGTIFFNNVGYLNMCGHGTIGLAVTLGHLGRIGAGRHTLETPVGLVPFTYDGRHEVALENVLSYRLAKNVSLNVEGVGRVAGDIAWGGNWFYLVHDHSEELMVSNVARLLHVTTAIKRALQREGITGLDGAEIDHIELFGAPAVAGNQSRNFVLCPGNAYDRSPCGTGTSAKLACLAADGKLKPGELWRQEGILGSVFTGSYREVSGGILPTVSGTAYVTAESSLLIDEDDPLGWGIE